MRKVINKLRLPRIDADDIVNKSNYQYSYLIGLSMMYIMFPLLSGLLVYKPVQLGWFLIPAGTLLTPFIYSIGNVTTEVYGINVGRNMMWWFIILSPVFIVISNLLIHLNSAGFFLKQHAYDLIFGVMPRVCIAGTIGNLVALHFNNIVVSKFKLFFEGKNYWIRSAIGTCGGEIVYNLISYPIMYLYIYEYRDILKIFVSVTLFKIIASILVIPLECIMQVYLKSHEKIDSYDYGAS